MSVINRIEQASACKVINLFEDEMKLYSGAGWKLALFRDAQLVEFLDPLSVDEDHPDIMSMCAMSWAENWFDQVDGEVWLVMCSRYQLRDPRRIVNLYDDETNNFVRSAFSSAIANKVNGDMDKFESWLKAGVQYYENRLNKGLPTKRERRNNALMLLERGALEQIRGALGLLDEFKKGDATWP